MRTAMSLKIHTKEKSGKFVWWVEFQVDETWVEDGFDLTDERALEMLSSDLQFANIGTELKARVIKSPDPKVIRRVQGYKD